MIFYLLVASPFILGSCHPTTKITETWVNGDGLHRKNDKSIFIEAITEDIGQKRILEDAIAKEAEAKGYKVFKSQDVPEFNDTDDDPPTQFRKLELISETGAQAIFTITFRGLKSQTMQIENPNPYPNVVRSNQGQRSYQTAQLLDVRTPSQLDMVIDRGLNPNTPTGPIVYPSSFIPPPTVFDTEVPVHFFETNLYDPTGAKLWSAQSETSKDGTIDTVVRDYAKAIFSKLEEEYTKSRGK